MPASAVRSAVAYHTVTGVWIAGSPPSESSTAMVKVRDPPSTTGAGSITTTLAAFTSLMAPTPMASVRAALRGRRLPGSSCSLNSR